MKLTKKIRLDILRVLLSEQDLFGKPLKNTNIIKFLDEMLDLKSLPSEDDRYSNAYDDAFQHLVNNYDWEYEYVLTDRFNIIDDPDIFINFLNRVIHPNVRVNEDDITRYHLLINPYLEKENLVSSITNQIAAARASITDLDANFYDQVVTDNTKMTKAYDELQKVVILFKTDMLQAFNISVDYVDADGD